MWRHACSPVHIQDRINTRTHTLTLHIHICACIHTYSYAFEYMHTKWSPMHIHTCMQTPMSPEDTYIYTYTFAWHIQTHTFAHTHKHTHLGHPKNLYSALLVLVSNCCKPLPASPSPGPRNLQDTESSETKVKLCSDPWSGNCMQVRAIRCITFSHERNFWQAY